MCRLVTLAVQNSALTIIMHYSRVSTPASREYSAATAVLMNEILKGTISLIIAFARVDSQADSTQRPAAPQHLSARVRKLSREVFSPDCWKLSIPAILYGEHPAVAHNACRLFSARGQKSSKITCSMSPRQISTRRRSR